MVRTSYRYELRRGDQTIATGHLTWDDQLAVGDAIVIGSLHGTVDTNEPLVASHERRLVVRIDDSGGSRR